MVSCICWFLQCFPFTTHNVITDLTLKNCEFHGCIFPVALHDVIDLDFNIILIEIHVISLHKIVKCLLSYAFIYLSSLVVYCIVLLYLFSYLDEDLRFRRHTIFTCEPKL